MARQINRDDLLLKVDAVYRRLFPCDSEVRPIQDIFVAKVADQVAKFFDLGLVDEDFVGDITSGQRHSFYGRFWEVEIALHMHRHGYVVSRPKRNLGPDFLCQKGRISLWIECTAVSGGQNLETHEERLFRSRDMLGVPEEDVTLRYTQALERKFEQMQTWFETILNTNDRLLIAVNGHQMGVIRRDRGGTVPRILGAVLPFGRPTLVFDPRGILPTENGIEFKPSVAKGDAEPIETGRFLKAEWRVVSAVASSHDFFLEGLEPFQQIGGLAVVHNPNATAKLETGALAAQNEWVAIETEDAWRLRRIQ